MSENFIKLISSSLNSPVQLVSSNVLASDELQALCTELVKELLQVNPFCLWLSGEMGAGKTSLCQSLFPMLGVSEQTFVQSPTYTVMSEYQMNKSEWIAHLDLYRLEKGVDLLDLGLHDLREYRGFVVEWPERISAFDDLLPSHVLEIEILGPKRQYDLWKVSRKKIRP